MSLTLLVLKLLKSKVSTEELANILDIFVTSLVSNDDKSIEVALEFKNISLALTIGLPATVVHISLVTGSVESLSFNLIDQPVVPLYEYVYSYDSDMHLKSYDKY